MKQRIGRYEVIGELASGGMAEILLARLVGPSGFERPVVLKRIRALEGQSVDLVSMFLDEARLAARIRHSNVVHVEDLGVESGEPYLVMEYLEGESVAGITRRLLARGETLPLSTAVYIVSEACAGLHAAHELVDASGRPLNVVHRDVSPQNIFATYHGDVKVLDFGIAKVDGRGSAAGGQGIMGKLAYMAPEQIVDAPFDRRVDVFALGIVLYELLTGHRLFQRFASASTMRAVLKDPIVPPSRIAARVPPVLERICLRALARERGDRYATAAEMRRELVAAMRALTEDEPAAELAALMQRAFEDRIEDKRILFRSLAVGDAVDHVPTGEVDATVVIPALDEATITALMTKPDTEAPVARFDAEAPIARLDAEAPVTRLDAEISVPKLDLARDAEPRAWRRRPALFIALTVAPILLILGGYLPRRARPVVAESVEAPSPRAAAPSSPPSSVPLGPSSVAGIITPGEPPASAPSAQAARLAARPARRLPPSASAKIAPTPSPPTDSTVSTASPPEPSPVPSASVRGFRRYQ